MDSTGKPKTTPPATTPSETHCRPYGRAARVSRSATTASRAAIAARPTPMVYGPKPRSAKEVAGKVKEKASTPSAAAPNPSGSAIRLGAVALSCSLMEDDSSIATLAAELRGAVAGLRPGDRLPSSRALMARHQVSPVTVTRAIGRLSAEGLVVTRPGSGTYVAERARTRGDSDTAFAWQTVPLADRTVDAAGVVVLLSPPPDGVIALSGGYLAPELQPVRALATAAARAVRRPGAWGAAAAVRPAGTARVVRAYGGRRRDRGGRDDHRGRAGGGDARPARAAAAGRPGAGRDAHYPGAVDSARAAGLRPVPVPVDQDGLRTDLLADAFAASGARALYCQPTFHNPTGTVLSQSRRSHVLDVARAAGAFVIEDDFARHLAIDPPPPPLISADREGRVVHISSLTKATAPSLRVAAVAARGPVAERIRATQLVDSFFVARPLQETALEFVGSPGGARHLPRQRPRAHSDPPRSPPAGRAAARRLSHPPPKGGMHPADGCRLETDENALVEAAKRDGVLVSPGRIHYPSEPPGPRLRVTHIAAANLAELAEGVRRLAQALANTS